MRSYQNHRPVNISHWTDMGFCKSTAMLSHAEWAAIALSTGPGVCPPGVLGGRKRGHGHPCSSRVPVLARVVARIRHLRSAVDEKLCVGAGKATDSTCTPFSTIINTALDVASPGSISLSNFRFKFGAILMQGGAQFLRYIAWHLRIVSHDRGLLHAFLDGR